MRFATMGTLKLVDEYDGRATLVEAVGLIIEATPQELKASAHMLGENVEVRLVPVSGEGGANLIAGVTDAVGQLREAVAACRAKHGRDAIRSMPWGTTLDAIDSGRTELHPDDLQGSITDQAFVRWLLNKPVHQRERLLRKVADEALKIGPKPGRYRDTDGALGTLSEFDTLANCYTFTPDGHRPPAVIPDPQPKHLRDRYLGTNAVRRLVPVAE